MKKSEEDRLHKELMQYWNPSSKLYLKAFQRTYISENFKAKDIEVQEKLVEGILEHMRAGAITEGKLDTNLGGRGRIPFQNMKRELFPGYKPMEERMPANKVWHDAEHDITYHYRTTEELRTAIKRDRDNRIVSTHAIRPKKGFKHYPKPKETKSGDSILAALRLHKRNGIK
jgi:hypothetical protein